MYRLESRVSAAFHDSVRARHAHVLSTALTNPALDCLYGLLGCNGIDADPEYWGALWLHRMLLRTHD